MTKKIRRKLAERKARWRRMGRRRNPELRDRPVFAAGEIRYDLSDKTRAVGCGGLGAFLLMFRGLGFAERLDDKLQLLKRHMPYHESDHVINIICNILAGGTNLENLEMLRGNEDHLKALGADRIPDPTTAGDFLRRFREPDIRALADVFDEVRLRVWKRQPRDFFEHAIIDADGSFVPTSGDCKRGIDMSYDGQWCYHALLLSLANTAEPLCIVNRPGNRPSHEGVDDCFDRAVSLVRKAGFAKVTLRGDTDFARTGRFDAWDDADVRFVFGFDARPNLKAIADGLGETAWKPLVRPSRNIAENPPRKRPENVKDKIVERRGYEHKRLVGEQVAEFDYRPGKCDRDYRVVVVVRKNLAMSEGVADQRRFWDENLYFFYITNEREMPADELVKFAMGRCDQENLIAQLKNGVNALRAPSNTLESNWAYMTIASGAWCAKAWFALLHPHSGTKAEWLRMEFRTFLTSVLSMPCQILKRAKLLIWRLLSWNPWTEAFLRGAEAIRGLCLK